MKDTALILAAHGSASQPDVNARIQTLAAEVASRGLFSEVTAAFHQGEPRFCEIIDRLQSRRAIVVPMMTSEGYYSAGVLPRELARNSRIQPWSERSSSIPPSCYPSRPAPVLVHVTRPVGTHPAMADLVARRAARILRAHALSACETSLAIIGHGTPRHPTSRNSTVQLAANLARRGIAAEAFAAFLDEAPFVESIPSRARSAHVIAVLFLISPGPHATRDIPRRLGLHADQADCAGLAVRSASLPLAGRIGDRHLVCDAPVGTDPAFVDVVLQLARPPCPTSADAPTEGGSQARALDERWDAGLCAEARS